MRASRPSSPAERDAHEDALEHRLRNRVVVEVRERVGAERGSDQPELVRPHRVVDERDAGVPDRQVRERAQDAAPLGRVAVAVQLVELRAGLVAEREQKQRAARVVHRPGVDVGGIGRRVERPSADAPADGREERADRLRLSQHGRDGVLEPAHLLGRRPGAELLPEKLLGGDHGISTSIRSAFLRTRIARGTTVSAAWL